MIAAALLVILNLAGTDGVLWLNLRADAAVHGASIRLSDIAEVDALDEATKTRLMRIEVARVDDPRRSIVLSRDGLEALLTTSLGRKTAIQWSGADRCIVRAVTASISRERVIELAEKHVREMLSGTTEVLDVAPGPGVAGVEVPSARYRLDFEVEGDAKNPRYAGLVNLTLVAVADGAIAGRYPVAMIVRQRGEVVVAVRRVPPGRKVAAEDVAVEVRELSRYGADVLSDPLLVVGRAVPGGLQIGQVVTRREVKEPVVVRKNDVLTARLVNGGIVLEAVVVARQEGAIGETILVENADSKLTLRAVVVDSRTVTVHMKN